MYIAPSSTSGVASTYSFPDVPPSGTAKASLRFLTVDLLMMSSAEYRCEPKSWWFMSQLCGSGLRSRSKVTSAACTPAVLAISAENERVRQTLDAIAMSWSSQVNDATSDAPWKPRAEPCARSAPVLRWINKDEGQNDPCATGRAP